MLRTMRWRQKHWKVIFTNWNEEIYESLVRYHRCTCEPVADKHRTLLVLSHPVIKLWCAHKALAMIGERATAEAKNKSTKYEIESINQLPNLASLLSDPIQRRECCRGWRQRLITTQLVGRNWVDSDHGSHIFYNLSLSYVRATSYREENQLRFIL